MSNTLPTLLVVDDEEINRSLIGEYLEDSGYDLIYAVDGVDAWEQIDARPGAFDAILLDRMMPRMNGIELLMRIKQDQRVAPIPVILQTAASSTDQIAEGMRLGAYYYLTKPYGRQALAVVVSTALADSRNQKSLREGLERTQRVLHLMTEAQFNFRTLEEARVLAAELANRAASPTAVVIGLSELMINAVEHGCLNVGYADKSRLMSEGIWQTEIERRLAATEYADRRASVDCRFREGGAEIVIRDPGSGFAWETYLDMLPERAYDQHGRGIAIARRLSFASLEYLGSGNTVRVTFPLA